MLKIATIEALDFINASINLLSDFFSVIGRNINFNMEESVLL